MPFLRMVTGKKLPKIGQHSIKLLLRHGRRILLAILMLLLLVKLLHNSLVLIGLPNGAASGARQILNVIQLPNMLFSHLQSLRSLFNSLLKWVTMASHSHTRRFLNMPFQLFIFTITVSHTLGKIGLLTLSISLKKRLELRPAPSWK